ncbi:unnamed protein product, partial [Mesorhabditis belari]
FEKQYLEGKYTEPAATTTDFSAWSPYGGPTINYSFYNHIYTTTPPYYYTDPYAGYNTNPAPY